MIHKESSVFSVLPVFLLKTSVVPGDVETTAAEIAGNLALWRGKTNAESEEASLPFALTIFSTTIVDNQNPAAGAVSEPGDPSPLGHLVVMGFL